MGQCAGSKNIKSSRTRDMLIKDKMKTNKLLKAGSMSLVATILTRAINLISVPIFSRLLTTSEYGQVEVFMTYVNIFFIVLGLDFQGTVGKGRLDHKDDADEYLCSSLLLTTIVSVVVVCVINSLFSFLSGVFGLERWAVNLMLLYSYAMFVINYRSSDYNFFYKYKENMRMTVSVGVLNVALSIVFILTLFKDAHFCGRILGATIPTVICAVIVYIGYVRRGHFSFQKQYNKYSLEFGIPLIPHNLSHLVLSSADRIMINSMISAAQSGIYSLAYTLGMMIQVASEALNQVFVPWLFRRLQEEAYEMIRKVQRVYLLLYCFVAVVVLSVSPEIVKVIGDREYWDGTRIILWIVFATFLNFTYTLYVNIEFFHRRTALISSGTIMAAIINVVLNLLFLQRFGYGFAAASTVISYFAMLVFHGIIVNKVLKIKIVDNAFLCVVVISIFVVTIVMQLFLQVLFARVLFGLIVDAIIAWIGWMIYKKIGKIEL